MIVKIKDKEFTFDGYYNTSQTIRNLAEKCYQQGRADAIQEIKDKMKQYVNYENIDLFVESLKELEGK